MSRLRRRRICLLALCCLTISVGCTDPCAKPLQALRDEVIQAEDRIDELEEDKRRLQDSIRSQKQLVQRLRALSDDRLANLFTVESVELGDYTTGANLDDAPGDDGVRVRLVPIDAAGSPLKAAGSVKIQLYDLADEEEPLVGKCRFPVENIGDHWSSHFGTYHYRFECPFSRPPDHETITVRVEFTDYLTGKVLHAQKEIQIDRPGETQEDPSTP